jgi:hypothetical protein
VNAESGSPHPSGAADAPGDGKDAAKKKRTLLYAGIGGGAILLLACCCCGSGGGWWVYDKYYSAPPFVGNWTSGPNVFLQLENNHRGKFFTDPFNPPSSSNLTWTASDGNVLEIKLNDAKGKLWVDGNSGRFTYEGNREELILTNTADKTRATFQKFEPKKK